MPGCDPLTPVSQVWEMGVLLPWYGWGPHPPPLPASKSNVEVRAGGAGDTDGDDVREGVVDTLAVGVTVAVAVGVGVAVRVPVAVRVAVAVRVDVLVLVRDAVPVEVAVPVAVRVRDLVPVEVGVEVAVPVLVAVLVDVVVLVRLAEAVAVRVAVGVRGVTAAWRRRRAPALASAIGTAPRPKAATVTARIKATAATTWRLGLPARGGGQQAPERRHGPGGDGRPSSTGACKVRRGTAAKPLLQPGGFACTNLPPSARPCVAPGGPGGSWGVREEACGHSV